MTATGSRRISALFNYAACAFCRVFRLEITHGQLGQFMAFGFDGLLSIHPCDMHRPDEIHQ